MRHGRWGAEGQGCREWVCPSRNKRGAFQPRQTAARSRGAGLRYTAALPCLPPDTLAKVRGWLTDLPRVVALPAEQDALPVGKPEGERKTGKAHRPFQRPRPEVTFHWLEWVTWLCPAAGWLRRAGLRASGRRGLETSHHRSCPP